MLAYTTATATPDPSLVCNLHHSSWQCGILNPLREARDRTHSLVVHGWIRFCYSITGTPLVSYFKAESFAFHTGKFHLFGHSVTKVMAFFVDNDSSMLVYYFDFLSSAQDKTLLISKVKKANS